MHSVQNLLSLRFFFFWGGEGGLGAQQPPVVQGLHILEVSRTHTTQHSRSDSSGRVISSSQRPLPDNTQHSQHIDIHAPGEIRTHNLSRRAAADLRLRTRGHWDPLSSSLLSKNTKIKIYRTLILLVVWV